MSKIFTRKKGTKNKGSFDKVFFSLCVVLIVMGIVFVADTSSPQALSFFSDPFFFAKQQIVWGSIGFLLLISASFIKFPVWKKISWPLFIISLFFLFLVLIPHLGTKVLGARRWLSLGIVSFQPSELVKLSLSAVSARILSSKKNRWILFPLLVFVIFLIMFQPDFGTAIVLLGIVGCELFVAGMPILYFLFTGLLVSFGGYLLIIFSNYRKARFLAFLRGFSNPLESSYHIKQILLALGSGGILGVGLGQSRQKHLFLPETATDSVFAIVAEEIGFIGAGAIIILFTIFVLRAFKIAVSAPDEFSRLFAVGIASWIGFQGFLNLASIVVLTPLTGIPLPFFSYGGSSLTTILLSVGILLNISKYG